LHSGGGMGYETEQTQHVALHPYDIPYASLTPIDHPDLLVPVCLASTHVAYCSTRMEPVFMMIGLIAGGTRDRQRRADG
jgi:FAD dependent oxidoreductase